MVGAYESIMVARIDATANAATTAAAAVAASTIAAASVASPVGGGRSACK